jgi:hypothetical protein
MRMRSVMVEVDFNPIVTSKLRARSFQFEGKGGRRIYGRMICSEAKDLVTVKTAIQRAFWGKIREVNIVYDDLLGLPMERMWLT